MAYSKKSGQKTKNGVCSPMAGFRQNENFRMPSTAGTSEMITGSAPKRAAKVSSPQVPFKK